MMVEDDHVLGLSLMTSSPRLTSSPNRSGIFPVLCTIGGCEDMD